MELDIGSGSMCGVRGVPHPGVASPPSNVAISNFIVQGATGGGPAASCVRSQAGAAQREVREDIEPAAHRKVRCKHCVSAGRVDHSGAEELRLAAERRVGVEFGPGDVRRQGVGRSRRDGVGRWYGVRDVAERLIGGRDR